MNPNGQPINNRNQRQNNQGQNNAAAQGNAQGARQQQNRPPSHPENSIEVRGGVISHFRTSYIHSEEGTEVLKGQFRHLLTKDSSRFYVGGTNGYKIHPHALGAELRRLYHNKLVYQYLAKPKDVPNYKVLDIGASPVRSMGSYLDGENWLEYQHMMCPNLGVRDDIREQNNYYKLQAQCREHNERERQIRPNAMKQITIDPNTGLLSKAHCKCAMKPEGNIDWAQPQNNTCACSRTYDAYTSIESWYYPGVMEGMFHQMIESFLENRFKGSGWIVGHDYYRMMLRQAQDSRNYELTDSVFKRYHDLHASTHVEWTPIQALGHGVLDIDGNPESTHRIQSDHSRDNKPFMVTAEVKGNATAYKHQIPLTADEDVFAYEVIHRGVKYIILMETMELAMNGDVPFVMYRARVTEKSKWDAKEIEELNIIPLRFAVEQDIMMDENVNKQMATREINRMLEENAKNKALGEKKAYEEDLKFFNEDQYESKCLQVGKEKRAWPDKMKCSAESHIKFLRWIKRQWCDRKSQFYIRIRLVDGEWYMVISLLERSFMNLFVTISKDGTYVAKVDDIIRAYIAIGIKNQTSSILHTMVQAQRNKTAPDHTVFEDSEAYVIARVFRILEAQRVERAVGAKK